MNKKEKNILKDISKNAVNFQSNLDYSIKDPNLVQVLTDNAPYFDLT